MLLRSNKAAILEKGGGNVRQSWGPLMEGIGSMFTDTRGQMLVDSLWADIKVYLPLFLGRSGVAVCSVLSVHHAKCVTGKCS